MTHLTALCLALLLSSSVLAGPVCPRETDPQSLRHSALGETPHENILRVDLDGDGDPDLLEGWWNGMRVRWFDENDDATAADVWCDMVHDSLQVDVDGDGFYDGPADYCVKWADRDGDGVPDIQAFNQNPKPNSETVFGKSGAVFFVTIDPDNTGLLMDIKWSDLTPGWTRLDRGPNWRNNYHGNATFLKEHAPVWSIENAAYSWENPFLFYDPDGDGLSEMSIRVADNRRFFGEGNNRLRFDGIVDEAWVSYDLDNDSGCGNEKDYDLTLHVNGAPGLDYNDQKHTYPQLIAPNWVLPYFRYPDWRKQSEFIYLKREKAAERLLSSEWERAYLTVDEDDDSHRWERVEIYYPGDPYVLKRRDGNSMITHPQSDSLGDRAEWDEDFSGKARLYRAEWDGKIHLFGAERGAWTLDRDREYWGGSQDNQVASTRVATRVSEVIQYYDKNGNGYLDTITFDYDGDQIVDRTDSLIELGISDNGTLIDPVKMDWNALRAENADAANRAWGDAQRFYRLAFRYGFADAAAQNLDKASSVQEKSNHAFFLRETLLRGILEHAPESDHPAILTAYYTSDMKKMEALLIALRRAG
jgi:hypothetical protein